MSVSQFIREPNLLKYCRSITTQMGNKLYCIYLHIHYFIFLQFKNRLKIRVLYRCYSQTNRTVSNVSVFFFNISQRLYIFDILK